MQKSCYCFFITDQPGSIFVLKKIYIKRQPPNNEKNIVNYIIIAYVFLCRRFFYETMVFSYLGDALSKT